MAGKPRTGWIFDLMRRSRSHFKLALLSCRRNEEQFKTDAIARDLLSKNSNEFWRKVKLMSCSKSASSSVVREATNEADIAETWKQHHFQNFYNQHDNENLFADRYQNDNNFIISVDDLRIAIQKLKRGKSVGNDGIAAEALLYGGDLLFVQLTIMFNMCISHRYLPNTLMATTIIPVIKNRTGDMSDLNNYRAIAISNGMAKLLECIILNCFMSCDIENDVYQFGFKTNRSTVLACAVLKNVINYYRENGSYVFVTTLDLSKAFDLVDHSFLFKKLIDLKLPCNVIHLLA
ncbi:MAG: reverse transcriptase domain-containing protein [Candidatus Lokiarchaeota archaeon]|jgi:hypothetical protein